MLLSSLSIVYLFPERKEKKAKDSTKDPGFAWKIPSDKPQQANAAPSVQTDPTENHDFCVLSSKTFHGHSKSWFEPVLSSTKKLKMPAVLLPSLVGGEHGCIYMVSEDGAAKAAKQMC